MVKFLVALFCLSLAGCASTLGGEGDRVAEGSAVYRIDRTSPTGETCHAEAVSARPIASGELKLTENCALEVQVEATDTTRLLELMRLLGTAP